MADQEKPALIDLRPLHEASASLLGYFVHTWYTHYLVVVTTSLRRLLDNGLIASLTRPTERGRYVLFDFGALDTEKLTYLVGIYFYVLSCHKWANHELMHRHDGTQVLYLRGYDYEGSVASGGGGAMGFSSSHTMAFGESLRDLLPADYRIFKVMSPKDVYWETIDAQRYFGGDYSSMIGLIRGRPGSVYLNALSWQEGVADLLDRMDHYVVYVSSITHSALWELEQLDTEHRRERVTVVFDEEAIANKEMQLAVQEDMRHEYGNKVIWTKEGPPPALTAAELRDRFSKRFLVTTPEDFKADIDRYSGRIAQDSSRLRPGERETWLDFQFHPAIDADALTELRNTSSELQVAIDAAIATGIECLPLFLNQVQLRIYMTLLMGEHDQTGRALAAYAAVTRGALDYFEPPVEKIGDLSAENRESHLETLRDHLWYAEYAGVRLLAYGKSHEFDDFSAAARVTWDEIFDATSTAVARFFDERGGPL
jgi:hypothetical protein